VLPDPVIALVALPLIVRGDSAADSSRAVASAKKRRPGQEWMGRGRRCPFRHGQKESE
jgi:hypothetical protein